MKNRNTILAAILSVLACFAFLPQTQAVEPGAPETDRGGGNTSDGNNALLSLTTGTFNTAIGFDSLLLTSDTSFNTGVGAGTLLLNTGTQNSAVGAGALLSNSTGSDNNAVGAFALFNNTTAFFNNAHGRQCLFDNVDGSQNNAMGDLAMEVNVSGSFNTAMGDDALDACVDGNSNVAIGDEAGTDVVHGSHIICIGAGVVGGGPFADLDNTCYIGSIDGEPTSDPGSTVAVLIDSNNVLGTAPSSRSYKHDIKPMDKASEAILALKPVTFHYNGDKKNTPCFGLIAEDVAEVSPDLVVRDKNGELTTVRYEQINAMLLNEFLKEHKRVEEQQSSISQLKSEMQGMVAQLKEQAAQIQKVSAQLQVNKPAPQVVANKP
jgi:trimeric autotransporter adhesin